MRPLLLLTLAHLGLCGPLLCEQFASHLESGYGINNNLWGSQFGSGSQCTYVDSVNFSGIAWHVDWTWHGLHDNVKSYPYSGRDLAEKKLISKIRTLPTAVDWTYDGSDIRANVAFDLFTAANPGRETNHGDYELMVWLAAFGDIYPIGQSKGVFEVGGMDWQLYDGFNGDMHVYTFVAPQPLNSWQADLKPFFDYLSSHHDFPSNLQHLLTFQVGTEPFTGGPATFNVKHFWGEIE